METFVDNQSKDIGRDTAGVSGESSCMAAIGASGAITLFVSSIGFRRGEASCGWTDTNSPS